MLIKRTPGWAIPERLATPESVYLDRRRFLGTGLAGAGVLAMGSTQALAVGMADPSATLYPFPRNPAYTLDRPVTDEATATTYNNFYEFGSHKQISEAAAANLKIRPWTVKIDGLVAKEQTFAIDELIAKMPNEERLYRHRCVEAWSMAVPWTGFPVKELVKLAEPLGSAKYLRMQTFMDLKMSSGQHQSWYPWPYTEGLSMAEATNDLAFMAIGVYGKPLPASMGSPLRLAVPWKYGFKSVKSIVRFSFTEERPKTFWEALQSQEYGFWANVNPQVPHPRWSQATEEVIGTNKRVPTQLFNGYAEQVASLYPNPMDKKLYM